MLALGERMYRSNNLFACVVTALGVDDMSCFLIDDSRTPVPRTPRDRYNKPITEKKRRKVIQYVAYADGVPDIDYDHGKALLCCVKNKVACSCPAVFLPH